MIMAQCRCFASRMRRCSRRQRKKLELRWRNNASSSMTPISIVEKVKPEVGGRRIWWSMERQDRRYKRRSSRSGVWRSCERSFRNCLGILALSMVLSDRMIKSYRHCCEPPILCLGNNFCDETLNKHLNMPCRNRKSLWCHVCR